MSEWTRDISAGDFKVWLTDFVKTADEFDWETMWGIMEPTILEMEQEDYFGTEGFDKRFG